MRDSLRSFFEGLHHNRRIVAVVGFAFVLRLVFVSLYGFSRVDFQDTTDYLDAAAQLCRSGAYPRRGVTVPFFRPPGLPLFLALFSGCHLQQLWLQKVLLIAGDAVTVGVLAISAGLLFGTQAATIAAIVAAVYPPFIFQSAEVSTEPLYMLLQSSSVYFFLKGEREQTAATYLLAGLLTAFAALTRPLSLAFIVLFPLANLLLGRAVLRYRFCQCAIFVGGAVMALAPWAHYNQNRYSETILVNDGGGYNLWRGASPEMRQIYGAQNSTEFTRLATTFEQHSQEQAAKIEADNPPPLVESRRWSALASEVMREDPIAYALYTLQKFLVFWRPWLNPAVSSAAKLLFSGMLTTFTYALAVLGYRSVDAADRSARWFVPLYLLSGSLLSAPFQVVARFRVPLADPLLVVLAAGGLSCLLWQGRTRSVDRTQIAS